MTHVRMLPNRRHLLAGAAATTLAAPSLLRAQSAALKVGVLLPRSGFEAGIGQDCQRGVDVAPAILKSLGLPELTIMDADTESNVEHLRTPFIGAGKRWLHYKVSPMPNMLRAP